MDIPRTLNDLYTFPGYRPLPTLESVDLDDSVVVTLVRHRIPQKESVANADVSRVNCTILASVVSMIFHVGIDRSGCRFHCHGLSVCGVV
jgi:hypothetical protein